MEDLALDSFFSRVWPSDKNGSANGKVDSAWRSAVGSHKELALENLER